MRKQLGAHGERLAKELRERSAEEEAERQRLAEAEQELRAALERQWQQEELRPPGPAETPAPSAPLVTGLGVAQPARRAR